MNAMAYFKEFALSEFDAKKFQVRGQFNFKLVILLMKVRFLFSDVKPSGYSC